MWAPWYSLEKLSSLNNWILGLAALFGFLAAVGVIAGWFLGARVSELQKAELSQFQTDAQTKIALANQTAAQANERAEELARENLQIRHDMADRVLMGDAQKLFVTSIRSPGHVGTVTFLVQDREASDYANDIFSALKEAGWSVGREYRQPYDSDPRPRGITIRTAQNPDPVVKSVIYALEKTGAKPRTEVANTLDKGYLNIVVGTKTKD